MEPTERPDDAVSLGEVNRNLNQFRIDVKSDLKEIKEGFVPRSDHLSLVERVKNLEVTAATKAELSDIRGLIQELRENLKSKGTTYIALAGILIPSGIAIWAVVR